MPKYARALSGELAVEEFQKLDQIAKWSEILSVLTLLHPL